MMLQALDRARKSPEHIEVCGLSGEYGGQCRICSLAVESGASDACAGKKVRDGLHVVGIMVAERTASTAIAITVSMLRTLGRLAKSGIEQPIIQP